MTYNVHGWRDSSHGCNYDRILDLVQEIQPDIICLNEVLHPFSTSSASPTTLEDYYHSVQNNQGRDHPVPPSLIPSSNTFLDRLAESIGLPHWEFVQATDNSYFGKGVSFGNAILTSNPILKSCAIKMEVEEGDLDLGRQKRDFVDPRSCGVALVQMGDDCTIGVGYAHLDHKSEELREKQIQTALGEIDSFLDDDNVPRILCGDLNTFQKSDCDEIGWEAIVDLYLTRGWPLPPERSLVLDALTDHGYQDTFYGSQNDQLPDPTSWTNNPLMRIDHIYVQQPTENGATKIVPNRHYRVEADASDHFPVVLEASILQT